ncbi:unnamed protein product [Meloidogyne enterolobii]|uniref:Uncharacterized protein n=1 Tax=Meloidogyne enterolobii TaxID=390850 RepID=A0ACB0XWP7_MELEN
MNLILCPKPFIISRQTISMFFKVFFENLIKLTENMLEIIIATPPPLLFLLCRKIE